MSDPHPSTPWEVVVTRAQDPGRHTDGGYQDVVVRGSEPEARRVYADTVAAAAAQGYDSVVLRSGARDVERWPQPTGWTV